MQFKIDENLPVEIAAVLTKAGYDATTVLEQRLSGSSDADIAMVCRKEERILITLDLDFADIRAYPPKHSPGIIILRLKQQDRPHIMELFEWVVPMLSRESLRHHLWIVEERQIRIRE